MRIKTLGCIGLMMLLSACVSPEQNQSSETVIQGTSDATLLQAEQGRTVTQTIASADTGAEKDIPINAVVTVPDAPVIIGSATVTLPTVGQIETLLTDGKAMEVDAEGDSENAWILPADEGSDLAFHMSYRIESELMACFGDETITTIMQDWKKETELQNDERSVLNNLTEKAETLFASLGWQGNILDREMATEGDRHMAEIRFTSTLDGVPIVRSVVGLMGAYASITGEGVASFQYMGSVEKTSTTEEVSVISVDELLSKVTAYVAEGQIPAYGDTITHITLAYYLAANNDFYPVWCLYGDEMSVDICLNAQDGTLVSLQ